VALARRDVPEEEHGPRRGVVGQRGERHVEVTSVTGGVLDRDRLAVRVRPVSIYQFGTRRAGVGEVLAHDGVGVLPAEQPTRGGIGVHDAVRAIDDDDGVVHLADDRLASHRHHVEQAVPGDGDRERDPRHREEHLGFDRREPVVKQRGGRPRNRRSGEDGEGLSPEEPPSFDQFPEEQHGPDAVDEVGVDDPQPEHRPEGSLEHYRVVHGDHSARFPDEVVVLVRHGESDEDRRKDAERRERATVHPLVALSVLAGEREPADGDDREADVLDVHPKELRRERRARGLKRVSGRPNGRRSGEDGQRDRSGGLGSLAGEE